MVKENRWWRPVAAVVLLAGVAGCPSLDIVNKNAPERERAFSDPATVKSAAAGTLKSYINRRTDYEPSLAPFSTMSDEHTFSWNNFQSRYYSTYGAECPMRCGWANVTTASTYEPLPIWWYGLYSVISSANDVLFAIRKSPTPPNLGSDAGWVEAVAQLSQGVGHALIALTYDRGFVVTENDTDPSALQLVGRNEIRDAAIQQLDKAADLATAADFSVAPNTLFGLPSGPTYTGAQIARMARTFQAELLVMFARTAQENAQTNWGQVVSFASRGISSGTAFNLEAYQSDRLGAGGEFFTGVDQWGSDYGTTRIDTRVARLLAKNQKDPWPGGAGNPQPEITGPNAGGVYGVDKRMGDGGFLDGNTIGDGEPAATPNSGTDFLWDPSTYFIAARGQMHQSNIGYMRYHCLVGFYPDCPTGAGNFVVMSKYANDLMWAEGLIRTNQNLGLAAQLINNSRVGRGGLPPVTAASGSTELLKALFYEWHVELVSMYPDHWFNARRLTKTSLVPVNAAPWATGQSTYEPEGAWVWIPLWGNSPRSMPIPAKEVSLLGIEIYSFGGPDDPGGCGSGTGPACVMGAEEQGRVKNVHQIFREIRSRIPPPGTRLRQ